MSAAETIWAIDDNATAAETQDAAETRGVVETRHGASLQQDTPTTTKRRVLVLPLENVTASKEHAWMRQSLADSLKTELLKTQKFEVLDVKTAQAAFPELVIQNPNQAEAVILARQLNCEVVTQGRFVVRGGQFRLEMEATDALAGTSLGAEKADGTLDAAMFNTIDTVVETLTAGMVTKLPEIAPDQLQRNVDIENKLKAANAPPVPETKPETIKPKPAQVAAENTYHANAYLTLGVPMGSIANHVGTDFGARASLWRNFLYPWLNPMVAADAFFAGGKDVGSMFFYYAGAGLTYPIAVVQSITLLPFATVGFSGGKLDYQSGYTFLLPALDVGASAEWALSERLRLAAALSYRHVFDPTLPGSFVQLHLGAGYIF